eukprot:Gb_07594 [translate_table: standard]
MPLLNSDKSCNLHLYRPIPVIAKVVLICCQSVDGQLVLNVHNFRYHSLISPLKAFRNSPRKELFRIVHNITMTAVQERNFPITRAQAAKSASSKAGSRAMQPSSTQTKQPTSTQAGQKKTSRGTTKRAAADETNNSAANTTVVQTKRRAVLGDVSNFSKETAAVGCLAKPKTEAHTTNAKGRGPGIPRSRKKNAKAAQAKKKPLSVPFHVENISSDNVVVVEEKSDESQQEEAKIKSEDIIPGIEPMSIPEDTNPATEQISIPVQCQQTRVKLNHEEVAVSVKNAAIASLDQRALQNLNTSAEPKTALKQGREIFLFSKLELYNISFVNQELFNDKAGKNTQAKLFEGVGWSTSVEFIDIDSNHKDPQMCSIYASEIYDHMRIAELKRRPLPSFMETVQHDINPNMRSILVDWLVEVSEEYKLVPDTLYLAVSYIDRFLSANAVIKQKLQLLGVSCMLIASKYEEICAPHVDEFCYITDNTYTREEVLDMETRVLNYLHFELTTPTTKSFLRRFVRAAQAANKATTLHLEFMGNYLAELTLVEYDFLQYLPSLIAASAVFLARIILDSGAHPWNSTLQHYTGYKASDLRDCVYAIYDLQVNKKCSELTAVRDKYRQHRFKCVSSLVPPPEISPEFFTDV